MKFENDMLYLSLCALNDRAPDIKRVEKMDLDILYKYCKAHNIVALVCYALETVITPPKNWLEEKGKAIRKNLLFDIERQKITSFMDKNNIKYLPLKGILLKDYYPKAGMRQMSDNDIYFNKAFKEHLKEFMLSAGYRLVSYDNYHDVYEKPPVYNFEMHHSLFEGATEKQLYKYYSDIEKRLIKDEATNTYHLSDEDFYIYIIAHEYKHYSNYGTGIRSLLDCYILLNRFENKLDWNYIKLETDKLGLTKFEESQRQLCKKLLNYFDRVDFTNEDIKMLNYFVSGGVYGNLKTSVVNQLTGVIGDNDKKITFNMKAKYVFQRLFPPMEFYKLYHPFFYRHKYLLPICFFYRIFKLLFKKSKKQEAEIQVLKSKNNGQSH